jgi:uncharacterized protein YndB with AHSA1/START domain
MAEMTTDTIRVSAIVPAPPERVYGAWLDSAEHSAITRSTASIEPWVGGRHSAWGGSIRGTMLELSPNRRIVQSWWASDFPPGSEESRLEVLFEPVPGGTLLTINHTGLPQGRGHRYEDGWKDFYLDNMRSYFPAHPEPPPREESPATIPAIGAGTMEPAAAPAAKRAVAKSSARPAAKRAVAKSPARPTAKRATARKPRTGKAAAPRKSKPARKTAARARAKPARAHKAASKPRRTPAKAHKRSGRVAARRGR